MIIIEKQRAKKVGRFLSLILRHQPEKVGIILDEAGWVEIDKLLTACRKHHFPITYTELMTVVQANDKKRFALNENRSAIRAVQGHSIPIQLGYQPITPPELLYHGTATRFVHLIQQAGLVKQSRHHVHLSRTEEIAYQVGARHGKPVVLTIQAKAMHDAGFSFYRSDNGVWLTDHVPVKYIQFPKHHL